MYKTHGFFRARFWRKNGVSYTRQNMVLINLSLHIHAVWFQYLQFFRNFLKAYVAVITTITDPGQTAYVSADLDLQWLQMSNGWFSLSNTQIYLWNVWSSYTQIITIEIQMHGTILTSPDSNPISNLKIVIDNHRYL